MTALPANLKVDRTQLLSSICRDSFEHFVRTFWEFVPGAEQLVWNWHLAVFCQELQEVAERVRNKVAKKHDVICNVPPGTSKSTIWSILFPAWVWVRMPYARFICASHTSELVLDLAGKSRDVIRSPLYVELFPEICIKEDQDAKGNYGNAHGGSRLSCTVAGKTPTGFHGHFLIIDDPLDPQRAVSEAELNTAAKFCTSIITTRKTDKNITVLCLIMQRVHVRDPTAAMLEVAEKEGAAKIRHICLPAEESDEISPPELRERYTDGLLDPVRLGSIVLAEAKANLGEYDYSSQFGQNPKVLAGGMFREEYFTKRVRVAPYDCVRVRFWDRAATESGGAYTAGVLIGRDKEGNCFVEDCIHGQWETGKREEIQLAAAQRDRSKYGPSHEPRIYIEHEPGSAGVDAYRATARKLAGFRVFPIHPTGSKDTRAEPWSSQCAAGNVFLVDNGESDGLGKARWDLNGYILEHCLFRPEPGKRLGKWKDRVDASSGAFNVLFGVRSLQGLRTYSFGGKKPYKGQRCVIVTRDELVNAVFEQKSILISLSDPDPVGMCEIPPHSLPTLLDSLVLQFANINPESHQESWEDPVEAYGKRPEELIVNSQTGKKLWSFLLRKREIIPQVVVFCDDDEERALSLVMAVCDVLRLPRNSSIYLHAKPEDKITSENKPPNNHIYQMIRNTRGGVVA